MTTACGNRFSQAVIIKATASVNATFALAVVTGSYKVVAHPFLYIAGPKVKPPVKKVDRQLRALFY
jgi:hypothetical protein